MEVQGYRSNKDSPRPHPPLHTGGSYVEEIQSDVLKQRIFTVYCYVWFINSFTISSAIIFRLYYYIKNDLSYSDSTYDLILYTFFKT